MLEISAEVAVVWAQLRALLKQYGPCRFKAINSMQFNGTIGSAAIAQGAGKGEVRKVVAAVQKGVAYVAEANLLGVISAIRLSAETATNASVRKLHELFSSVQEHYSFVDIRSYDSRPLGNGFPHSIQLGIMRDQQKDAPRGVESWRGAAHAQKARAPCRVSGV
ncbi:MAG: hypothetical protein ACI36W_05230, partial [Coriobacteriales bacterium]